MKLRKRSYSQVHRHDFAHEMLVLDVDLSPLPASSEASGSERGYMGRCRSKTGRKLVREWLGECAPRLHQYGIVPLIQQVWAIPERVKLTDKGVVRVRL